MHRQGTIEYHFDLRLVPSNWYQVGFIQVNYHKIRCLSFLNRAIESFRGFKAQSRITI